MHLRSEIKRADHAFGSALADLRAYLKHRPRDAQAHLETATLLVTMGNPKAAEPHCAALRGLQATLPAALCDAQTMGVTGKSKDAAHKLESALVNHRHATNEVRGWGYTLLGELHARTNAVDGARRAFTLALLLLPRNEYARIAYADFLLAQDEPQAVMNLYPEPIETLHEAERVRVAIAALKLGRADAALIARSALTALQTAAKSEPRGHVREEAMFALHVQNDPKQAVALALRNWAIQREPIDAEILWLAGSRAGDTHAMRIAQRWYDDTGFERTVATPLARGAPGSF
jgi:tetratricopeptide (TPR) repeat protein